MLADLAQANIRGRASRIVIQTSQVILPHDAWSAIVKGAVLSQLPNEALVKSVVASRHDDVTAHLHYDEVRDAGKYGWYEASHGNQRVGGVTGRGF